MKLVLRNITKRFGTLVANDRISLEVEPGEVHCLLGENGAGKSTLMNVLYGLYQADEGEIVLDDVVQHFSGPGDAMAAGIGMVHQHFMLIPVFTVAENVMLGNESTGFAGTPRPRRRPRAGARDLRAVRLPRRPRRDRRGPAGRRPAAGRDHQGALARRPGAGLRRAHRRAHAAGDRRADGDHAPAQGGREGDRLHHPQAARGARGRRPDHRDPPRRGRGRGRAHRHQRRARRAHGRAPGRADGAQGRPAARRRRAGGPGPHASSTPLGQVHVDGISFTIRAGEVLAVAGVQGNGQTELTEALLGLQDHVEGSITLDGKELVGRSVRQILDAGVGFIPEDRQADGLVGGFSIAENLMLNRSFRSPFVRRGSLRKDALDDVRDGEAPGVRRPRPRHPHARPASSPAATSRRSSSPASSRATCACSWPPSRPAASTSAPSSSSTSRSSPRATAASRCSWCPPSSTRSSPSPTGSWCSTAGRSSASCPATPPARCSA